MPPVPPINVESRTMSDFLSLLDKSNGAAYGDWYCRKWDTQESNTVGVFGRDPSSRIKVQVSLQEQNQEYLLLRPLANVKLEEPALLVRWEGGNADKRCHYCQYISAVWNLRPPKDTQ